MKQRREGFLAEPLIDHDGDIFDYITELHEYLWKFVRAVYPNASGDLSDWVDNALIMAPLMWQDKNDMARQFREDKQVKHRELMEKWLDIYIGEKR